jgi:acetyltransferase-like isoleucine patch superfamily enzyme
MPNIQRLTSELELEAQYLISNLALIIISILGPGRLGSEVRALLLRIIGFNIGQKTLIRSGFKFSGHPKRLRLGSNTSINFNALFDLMNTVEIGDFCQIGPNVNFITSSHVLASNFHSRRQDLSIGSIQLEDFVWIGANATILGGVTIGRGSVIAAGSLVKSDVPRESIVAGVPAKVLRVL